MCFQSFGCTSNINVRDDYINQPKNNNSCLDSFNSKNLTESLERCDNLIEKFPNDPRILNDRSLIHILNGKTSDACNDIKKAFSLMQEQKANIDPLVKYQITIRNDSCAKR